MNKIIKTLLPITLLIFSFANGQSKAIGDAPLDLEKFNFNTKVSDLFPDKYKSKDYKDVYEINVKGDVERSIMIQKETAYSNNYSADKKAFGYEYLQKNWSDRDKLAFFKTQYFQKVNVATTLDGKIKVIGSVADELTKTESGNLLKLLNEKFGVSRKLKNSWNDKLSIYEWSQKDRIIRFVTAYNDESNTMKIVIDKDKKTIAGGEKEPHYVSYLFIINPTLKSEVFGKMNTGDFVYLDDSKD